MKSGSRVSLCFRELLQMAALLELSGKTFTDLLSEFCHNFDNKYVKCCKLPPSENLRLILTILKLCYSENQTEKNEPYEGEGPRLTSRPIDDEEKIDLCLKAFCHGCIHLLMHVDVTAREKENEIRSELMHKIVIECCKLSSNCMDFGLEFSLVNLEEFSKALRRDHVFHKQRIEELIMSKAHDGCDIILMPVSAVLGILYNLTLIKLSSEKDNINHVDTMQGKLFDSLLKMLNCVADDSIMAIVSELLSLFINNDSNKKKLWTAMKEFNKENISEAPYAVMSLLLNKFLNQDHFDIREDQGFCSFIQNGLLHHDSLTRKRAVYMLKCVIDYSTKEHKSSENNYSQWSKLNSFILLIETLEEKQLHVILPVLSNVQEIIELCAFSSHAKSSLHVSWLTTVLSRAFNHDNKYVTKWAIETSLHLDVDQLGLLTDRNWIFISGPLLSSLGESHLYEDDGNYDDRKSLSIQEQLKAFFLKCGNSHGKNDATIDNRKEFFKQVSFSLYNCKMSAVSFSYITEALSNMEMPGIIDLDLLNIIKSHLLSGISMYPTELKAAAHYLATKIVLNCLDTDAVTWEELVGFLKVLFGKGFITYGSRLWEGIRNKMTNCFKDLGLGSDTDGKNLAGFVKDFLRGYLSDKNADSDSLVESGLLLLYAVDMNCSEINVNVESTIEFLLEPLTNVLSKIGRNPYLSDVEVYRSMQIMEFIIRKCNDSSKMFASKSDKDRQKIINSIMNLFMKFFHHCFKYTRTNFLSVLNGEEAPQSNISSCLALQRTLCMFLRNVETPEESLSRVFIQHFTDMAEHCSKELSKVSDYHFNGKTELALQSLHLIAGFLSSTRDLLRTDDLENKLINIITEASLNFKLKSRFSNPASSLEASSNVKGFTYYLWSLVCFALKKHKVISRILETTPNVASDNCSEDVICLGSCDLLQLTNCIVIALDISVGKDITPLFNCLEILIPSVLKVSEDLTLDILLASWRVFLEQKRRDTTFWTIYEPVVRIVFSECLLLSESEKTIGILRQYWKKFEEIGEAKPNAFNVLLDHCCNVWKNYLKQEKDSDIFNKSKSRISIDNFTDLLVDACIFGKLQKKITRITQQTIDYFKSNYVEETIISNNKNRDYQVRTAVLKLFLLGFNSNSSDDCSFVCKFIQMLMEKDLHISNQCKRYYSNSVVHRQKLRIWQAVLVLTQFIDQDRANNMLTVALEAISSDNQPSIRYFIEWFLILLVYKYPLLRSLVWQKLDEATERRVTGITSVVSILGHLAVIVPDEEFSKMSTEAFMKILPWVQVHHMQARIHAQVVIWKLWGEAKRRKLNILLNEFNIIESLFTLKEHNASVVKARNEMKNNFYFKNFNPLRHYSLETIFSSLPKLSGLAADELMNSEQLSELAYGCKSLGDLKLYDSQPSLYYEVQQLHDQSREEDFNKEEKFTVPTDVQKKIVAWKPLPPSEDPFLQKADMFKSESRQSKLVLCASLIDKTPNLGGLCRTCEIFGVSTLTIGALRYLDDSSFKSLSVSSEKWLDIQQVMPRHLPKYLQDMKEKGYRLVGIEQTANSKLLQDYEFQENTVLVLGNEREGIPVDLIQVLDDCVEIPQQGIIRSLNVHVSGAIIIWEYFKQLLSKKN